MTAFQNTHSHARAKKEAKHEGDRTRHEQWQDRGEGGGDQGMAAGCRQAGFGILDRASQELPAPSYLVVSR